MVLWGNGAPDKDHELDHDQELEYKKNAGNTHGVPGV
jgi:hypothetical protein